MSRTRPGRVGLELENQKDTGEILGATEDQRQEPLGPTIFSIEGWVMLIMAQIPTCSIPFGKFSDICSVSSQSLVSTITA